MRIISRVLSIILGLGLIYFSFQSYFIIEVDTANGIIRDGLGRVLSEPPSLMKFVVFGEHWRGLFWWIADKVIFFGGLGLTVWLYGLSENEAESKDTV